MTAPVLNQVSVGAAPGDAITDQALLLQRWLREVGLRSEIYAEVIAPGLRGSVHYFDQYRPSPGEEWLIFHHSIGSAVVERLAALPVRLIVVYHNVTPPEFFASVDPVLARQMVAGRAQLALLRDRTPLALAVSPFNEKDLIEAGFACTALLPLALDERQYDFPPDPPLKAEAGPELLFVGRIVPNKKHADLIKLLYYYRRFRPDATLTLVGAPWMPDYRAWLADLAASLGLRDAVRFVGHVTQRELVAHYRRADVYVSMSEHEGFGKPLIESLYLGLPVLAYAAAAVPGTLGGAGVLFRHKHYEALAEVVDVLVSDPALRARLVARGRVRAQAFLEPAVRRRWLHYGAELGLWEARS
jgi:glycosyltransferase involved in cell wall biosynthesis